MDVAETLRYLLNLSMEGPTPYIILGVVVFFVFMEQLVLFSLLSPGSWSVIFVSFLAFAGAIPVPLLITSMLIGAVAGTNFQFYLGLRHGERFLRFVNRFPRLIDLNNAKTMRVSPVIVVLSYNLPQIRGIVPFVAGTSRMSLAKWSVASIIGVVSWLGCFIGMGMGAAWMFDGDFDKAIDWVVAVNTDSTMGAIFWLLTIGIAGYTIWKWRSPAKTDPDKQSEQMEHHA